MLYSVARNKATVKSRGKLKDLMKMEAILVGSEREASKGKKSASKANSPSATTADNSRGTYSPAKKIIQAQSKKSINEKSTMKKQFAVTSTLEKIPQVPQGLKSSFKGIN
jgi:hypothetical protein